MLRLWHGKTLLAEFLCRSPKEGEVRVLSPMTTRLHTQGMGAPESPSIPVHCAEPHIRSVRIYVTFIV